MINRFCAVFIFICFFQLYGQVRVGVFCHNFHNSDSVNISHIYENNFGSGNVQVNVYLDDFNVSQSQIDSNDVLYIHFWLRTDIPLSFKGKLINFFNAGKHIILSTEGSEFINGDKFTQTIWNEITGDSIKESEGGVFGTDSPPRFHNSNGAGGLSANSTLSGGTSTFASFTNLKQSNILHVRANINFNCDKLFAVDALHPIKPSIGTGTLYITGELFYPFHVLDAYTEIFDLSDNLVHLHKTLIDSNFVDLNLINNWIPDSIVLKNSLVSDALFPNVFSPNKDGKNDVFIPLGGKELGFIDDFSIFNRWGSIVYNTTSNIFWDGTFNGRNASEGVYFYSLKSTIVNSCDLNAESIYKEISGKITLFR